MQLSLRIFINNREFELLCNLNNQFDILYLLDESQRRLRIQCSDQDSSTLIQGKVLYKTDNFSATTQLLATTTTAVALSMLKRIGNLNQLNLILKRTDDNFCISFEFSQRQLKWIEEWQKTLVQDKTIIPERSLTPSTEIDEFINFRIKD